MELKRQFGLTEKQIGHYHETLNAIGTSLDDLARSFLDGKARAKLQFDRTLSPAKGAEGLVAQIEERMKGIKDKDALKAERALIAQIKDIATKNARLKEAGYMPLMRFGNHAVYATELNEEGRTVQRYFGMYESEREANAAARELRSEYPQATIEQRPVSQESYKLFAGVSPETLALFAEHADLSQDPLFQRYLQLAVSNRAALKRLIKRKGTPGFSRDVTRTLAHFIVSNSRLAAQN